MRFRASGLFRAARFGRDGDGGESLFGCGRAGCGALSGTRSAATPYRFGNSIPILLESVAQAAFQLK